MTPQSLTDPLQQVRSLIARVFFGAAAAVCLFAVGLLFVGDSGPVRSALAAGFVGLALLCLWVRRVRGPALDMAVGAVVLGGMVMVVLTAWRMGWGVNSPAIGFFALLVCMTCAISGLRLGLAATVFAGLSIGGFVWAETEGWIAGASAVADVPLLRRGLTQTLLLAAGLACGTLLAKVLRHFLAATEERERRFTGLLGIAADAYWEMAADYRLTHFSRREADGRFVPVDTLDDRPPWDITEWQYEDDRLDAHRADLEERQPFRDMPVRWTPAGRPLRHMLLSGEPRFDAGGRFLGYWGVARDVSTEVSARQAWRSTETRYRELFSRIPTPLVLHMRGRVVDANPAALALFGFPNLRSMLGQDITERYEESSAALARERMAQLDQSPLGHELPVAEFHLRALDGRSLIVHATGVRVETDNGLATLSIFLDDTERRAAEIAVRRSEALLSHVIATSPDLITLTELASGRYAMVNDAFTRMMGWTQSEVVGRTSIELGIWGHVEQRERVLASLRETGSVQDLPVEFVTKDGQQLPMRVSAARFTLDGRDYLVINARDVSAAERSRLEREAILENASIGIAMTRDMAFQLANPRFEQMFGWPQGTLVAQSGRVVWPDAEAYRQFGREHGPALGRGEQIEVEHTMRRRDGSTFLCRLLARAVDPSHPSRGGTIWIAEDVTERRAVEQALARARDDAEAANQAKSAFLANTSHEIRTPLNGLLGLARMARQADVDDWRRRQYLEQIGDSAEALSAIISDILDLSKIEAGKLHLEAVPFDLRTLLTTLQRGYAPLADARGLVLSLDIDPALPRRLLGDPLRVRQILSNYLSNAIKFTQRGSVRLLARRLDGDRLRFEVQDTGPGVAPDVQARLFQPFTQADQSTTRRFGGTGLGLSICRELAVLMNGEVGLRSEPGAGSCFWAEVELPATDHAAPASGFGALDEHQPLAGRSVLMVEDNPVNMMIAVALLEQWGVRVGQAGDGAQAVEAVRAAQAEGRPYDAVLMDVQMPVMSGYEATRLLRQTLSERELPVIALTAAALVSEREQALAAGMNDFLTKPIDAQRLHAALVAAIGSPRNG